LDSYRIPYFVDAGFAAVSALLIAFGIKESRVAPAEKEEERENRRRTKIPRVYKILLMCAFVTGIGEGFHRPILALFFNDIYGAAPIDAGEAIVFTYGQHVELDGPHGLSAGTHSLVDKQKGKYRLRDYTERGEYDKLGLPSAGGQAAPLIDVLHRVLWLLDNEVPSLPKYLEEASPNREHLRLVAQTLAKAGLSGGEEKSTLVTTTATEQSALQKLLANWRTLIDQPLDTSKGTMFGQGR